MFPFGEMMKLKYSNHSRARNNYFPWQPTPGRKVRDKRGKHSPPLVKLFENGMSKWTGAIFGILDVLLSMPKNSHTEQHECQKQEGVSGSRRQEGEKSSANKKTNRARKVLLTFQHLTFKCSQYESLCLMGESQTTGVWTWVCVCLLV